MFSARHHDVTAACLTSCRLDGLEQPAADTVAPHCPTDRERREMRDGFRVMDGIGHLNGSKCADHAVHHRHENVSVPHRREPLESPWQMRRRNRIAKLNQQVCDGLHIGTRRLTNLESHGV
jgi:hypothetical protein